MQLFSMVWKASHIMSEMSALIVLPREFSTLVILFTVAFVIKIWTRNHVRKSLNENYFGIWSRCMVDTPFLLEGVWVTMFFQTLLRWKSHLYATSFLPLVPTMCATPYGLSHFWEPTYFHQNIKAGIFARVEDRHFSLKVNIALCETIISSNNHSHTSSSIHYPNDVWRIFFSIVWNFHFYIISQCGRI